MGGELVDTSRLYARTLAQIQPEWLEKVGAHLLKNPGVIRAGKKSGQVSAYERATLYGLVVYSQRRIDFGKSILKRRARFSFEAHWSTVISRLVHHFLHITKS